MAPSKRTASPPEPPASGDAIRDGLKRYKMMGAEEVLARMNPGMLREEIMAILGGGEEFEHHLNANRILEGDDGRFYFSRSHLDEQALNDADEAPLIEKEKKTGAAEAKAAKGKAKAARTAEETPAPIPLAKMAAAVEPRDSDFSDLASTYMEGELGVDGVPATSDEGDFSSLSGMVCEL